MTKSETVEFNREADRRQANFAKCKFAKLVIVNLEVIAAQIKNQLSKDRIEELIWQIENNAQLGHDLDLETTLRIHAYVDNLISKE